jgi:hypothetical protein
MPFVLIVAGSVLLVAGVRGTHQTLYTLIRSDFTGPANVIYWFIAILIIGAVGYIPRLKPVSDAFLVLVILVLFLKRGNPTSGGFFQKFSQAINTTQDTAVISGGQSVSLNFPLSSTTLDNLGLGAPSVTVKRPAL